MSDRRDVTNKLPHGTLWSRGLTLAEAEIGRGPEPSARWTRRDGPSRPAPEAWESPAEGAWAAQAA